MRSVATQILPRSNTLGFFRSFASLGADRTAAVIDLGKHKELWEDIEDVLVSQSRRHEKRIPFEKVKADLIKSGKLRGHGSFLRREQGVQIRKTARDLRIGNARQAHLTAPTAIAASHFTRLASSRKINSSTSARPIFMGGERRMTLP